MAQQVYMAAELGAHLNTVRTDMVTLLDNFRLSLKELSILPNITVALDNHQAPGAPHPYATVGLQSVEFEYLSRTSTAYEVRLSMEVEVWLHFNRMDSQFDEREKWALVNSLINYLKNRSTISASFDQFLLKDVQGNTTFPFSQTQGAVLHLTVTKVATT